MRSDGVLYLAEIVSGGAIDRLSSGRYEDGTRC